MIGDDKGGDDKGDDDFDPWAEGESAATPGPEDDGGLEPASLEGADDLVSDWLADDGVPVEETGSLGVFVPEEGPEAGELPFAPSDELPSGDDAVGFDGAQNVEEDVVIEDGRADDAAAADVVPVAAPPVRAASRKSGWGQVAGVALGGVMAIPVTLGILLWGLRQDPLQVAKHVPESLAFLIPNELRTQPAPPVAAPVASETPVPVDAPAAAADAPAVTEDVATVADEAATDQPTQDEPRQDEASTTSIADATASDSATASPPAADEQAAMDQTETARAVETQVTDAVEPPTPSEPFEPATITEAGVVETPMPDESTVAALDTEPAFPPLPDAADPAASVPVADIPVAEPAAVIEAAEPVAIAPDFSVVDASAAAARTAFAALETYDRDAGAEANTAVPDTRKTVLMVEWYRQLVAAAEAFAGLERTAADAGLPLAGPPPSLRELQAEIVAEPGRLDQLARLSRNWFSYPARQASGVMVPGVLAGTRRVGPYWCSTVTMAEAGGRSRDLAIISRTEPAVVAGARVLVTGLIIDGDVVWASDVCSATPEGVAAASAAADSARGSVGDVPAADPFAAPVP